MKRTAIGLAVATAVAAGGLAGVNSAQAAPWLVPAIAGAAFGGTVAAHGPYAYHDPYYRGPAYAYSPRVRAHGYAPGMDAYAYAPRAYRGSVQDKIDHEYGASSP